jgi:hypothetical protein
MNHAREDSERDDGETKPDHGGDQQRDPSMQRMR